MANLPRCSSCANRKNKFGTICKYYLKGIPKEFLAEKQFCKHYTIETERAESNYDDLPVAKVDNYLCLFSIVLALNAER